MLREVVCLVSTRSRQDVLLSVLHSQQGRQCSVVAASQTHSPAQRLLLSATGAKQTASHTRTSQVGGAARLQFSPFSWDVLLIG